MATRTRGWIGLMLGCGFLAGGGVAGGQESYKPQVPELKVERYALPNGLTVLLHEDHKTPVAAVDIYYKVGSKDEKPGKTGFAHLFEHMMFLGSRITRSRWSGWAPRRMPRPTRIGPSITSASPATRWSGPSGSRPIGWASCCRR
jgi:Insulinase (Peptidase family M16)